MKWDAVSNTYGELGCSFHRSTNCLRLSFAVSMCWTVGSERRASHEWCRQSSADIRLLESVTKTRLVGSVNRLVDH